MKNKPQLIVALDVDTAKEASRLVRQLKDKVKIYKVGSQLFTSSGPAIVRDLLKAGKQVFLDLKFHDIPNTVANAVRSAVAMGVPGGKNTGVLMCTVHTIGGLEMLQRAAQAAAEESRKLKVKKTLIIGITVLTSDDKADNIQKIVLERAKLAKVAGLDGVVASSQEASLIRKELGEDFIIVTPGIRPAGADTQDQKRTTTPKEAIKNGSDFLVVGRPIVAADDPLQAAKSILKEFNQ